MLRNIDTRRLKLLAQTDKSVARTRREWEQGTMRYADDNLTLLWRCARDWDAMDYLRKEHSRNLRYKNGDQWSDTVPNTTISSNISVIFTDNSFRRPRKRSYMPAVATTSRSEKC